MDTELQELYHQYQLEPEIYREAFQQKCQRAGLLGPILAEAAHTLRHIFLIIQRRLRDRSQFFNSEHWKIAQILAYLTWESNLEDLDQIPILEFDSFKNFVLSHIHVSSPYFPKNAELILPLILYIYRNYHSVVRGVPTKQKTPLFTYHQGIEGILIDKDSVKEFGERIGKSLPYERQLRGLVTGTCEIIARGYYDADYAPAFNEYESLAELLPQKILEALKAEWDSEIYRKFGEFLKEEYQDWFLPAIFTGVETGCYDELYKNLNGFIEELRWESGARAILLDTETVEIWISLPDLRKAVIKGILSLDELLEELDPIRYHLSDDYWGFNEESAKDRLLDEIPEEFRNLS